MTRGRTTLLGLAAILAVAAVAAWFALRPPPPPHIILITIDTLRRDHVTGLGDGARTPNLAALARRGACFTTAEASCPLTLPSHASMLTGLEPCRHGLRDNLGHVLAGRDDRAFSTLAEILADSGYETAAFVSGATLDAVTGIDAGFGHYEDPEGAADRTVVHLAERTAGETVAAVERWLDEGREGDGPLFLWVHLFDPHAPYVPPYPFDVGTSEKERYAGEVEYADDRLGALLAGLDRRGILPEAVVAVLSDHGEGLGQHGERTHGHLLHESTLAIPFVLAGPGVPGGSSVDRVVRTTDLVPTILGLVGLPVPPDLDGRDLRPVLAGTEDLEPPAYAESLYAYRECGWAQQSALRAGRWKLVDAGPRRQLFDLGEDPDETRDLAPDETERVDRMLRALTRIRETPPPRGGDASAVVLAVGAYGPAGDPSRTRTFLSPAANASLPAPVDRMSVVGDLDRARTLFSAGRHAGALEILDGLVSVEGRNPSVRFWRAYTLRKAGRPHEAADEAARAMELGLRDVKTRDLRLNALALAGRHEELDRVFAAHVGSLPESADAHLARAASLLVRKRFPEAREELSRALDLSAPGTRSRSQAVAGLTQLADPATGAPDDVRNAAARRIGEER